MMMHDSHSRTPADQQAVKPCRRRFLDEFKRDAVRLITDGQYTFQAAAEAVGVSQKSLREWHKKFASAPDASNGAAVTVGQLQADNRRLRQQLKRAEMEREILKKATAYFASQQW
jgi:transposase